MNLQRLAMMMLGLSFACAAQKSTVADVPTFPKGTSTVLLPYTQAVDFRHLNSLRVNMSFNGGPASSYQVDTGSVGIVVGAQNIPDFDGKGEPGELTYSSSGVHEMGVWKDVAVTFPDAKGTDGKPVTAHVRVLAVTSMDCKGTAVNHCTPAVGPPNPHMLGIGFGRGKGEVFDNGLKNAFLMLDQMQSGAMRRGYTITPAGIQLGLNAETFAGGGWKWQKLTPREGSDKAPDNYQGPKDWETAAGTFELGGKTLPMGTVLMDTGLTNMIIEAKDAPKEGDVPQGTPMRVELLGGQLHYDFVANDPANPTTPRKVSWRAESHGTYVNTGLKALALFDYAYDADGGYLGLKPR